MPASDTGVMAFNFGSLIFTDAIKKLQEKHGSRRQYARREAAGWTGDPIGPSEKEFLADRDSFYVATVGEGGWPYVQHRGGAPGFVKVLEDGNIAFADLRGNKQYISAGNLMTNDRVALIFMDYPNQTRLKILGHVQILEGEAAAPLLEKFEERKEDIERVFVIRVEATDWNCPQHITPRFTQDEIRNALSPWEERLATLQKENEELRRRLRQQSQPLPQPA